MKKVHGWQCLCLAALGLTLGMVTGCQTWVAGMTLPSGHYLEHPPQYFPETPPFPLSRELAAQEAIAIAPPGGPVGAPPLGAGPAPVAPRFGPPGEGVPPAPPAPIPGGGGLPPVR
jgi:hypothetical protein